MPVFISPASAPAVFGSAFGSFTPAAGGMGVGAVGIGDPNVIFKRKFRWTVQIAGNGACGATQSPAYFVKVAARPSIQFEETEVHFMNDKIYIPGKATWEPITITFLDCNQFGTPQLLTWLSSVYNFSQASSRTMGSKRSAYSASVVLKMYDGCGGIMETWNLADAWPQAMNFGDLDYANSEVADIQITLRYSMVTYTPGCGQRFSPCRCSGC